MSSVHRKTLYLLMKFLTELPMNSNAFEEINRLPIKSVLDWLGIKYSGYSIREWDRLTKGWKINPGGNYVNDLSNDRASGWPFAMVKNYLKLSSKETFAWFETHFGIRGDEYKPKRRQQKISNKIMRKPYSRFDNSFNP